MDNYEGNIFNSDPDFERPFENLLRIGENSAANGTASTLFSMQVPLDILRNSRTTEPDMGAYESVDLEND